MKPVNRGETRYAMNKRLAKEDAGVANRRNSVFPTIERLQAILVRRLEKLESQEGEYPSAKQADLAELLARITQILEVFDHRRGEF